MMHRKRSPGIGTNDKSQKQIYGAVRSIVEQNAFILPIAHASAKVWGVQGAKVGLVQNFTDGSTSGQMCLSLGA